MKWRNKLWVYLNIFLSLWKHITSTCIQSYPVQNATHQRELLLLPAVLDVVKIMLGNSSAKFLAMTALPNETISSQTTTLTEDLNDQLIEHLRNKANCHSKNVVTENWKDVHLTPCVWFVDENTILEDLFFCKQITRMSKAEELLAIIHDYRNANL